MADQPAASNRPRAAEPAGEPRLDRWRRHGHRGLLYTWAALLLAMLIILIALIIANSRQVPLHWVFGKSHASLIWIIVISAILGWIAGIATGALFRRRTRR